MGNKPERQKHRFVVFGAQDKGDKSVLAYKDRKSGMFAVKILQNTPECNYAHGEIASSDYARVINETDGEYITMYFAHKNGVKSIDALISQLELVKEWIESDPECSDDSPFQPGDLGDCNSCVHAGRLDVCEKCINGSRYLKGADCAWK